MFHIENNVSNLMTRPLVMGSGKPIVRAFVSTFLYYVLNCIPMRKQITAGVIIMISFAMIVTVVATIPTMIMSTYALVHTGDLTRSDFTGKAPTVISGDNIYIVWWANNTGNDEVQFRGSTDGGATFADKINLSNTTSAESQDVEIATGGDAVIVTWWERNQTSDEPVARISTDNGATFGPLLKLATNGTISGDESEG
ncbi:MAG: hypothetical protein P0116_07660 [Candidatus Nitrosocosmicus sp.]|nr:hypothetical protein [Candidatus Nitrosocosmicus sp.]